MESSPAGRTDAAAALARALDASAASARLDAAFAAGTRPDPSYVPVLVARCAVESDFFVRDTLTWALTRHPSDATVDALLAEVTTADGQARSQALHTLTKIGDPRAWQVVTPGLLHDDDDRVARAGWRLATQVAPPERVAWLAEQLAGELGRGDADRRRSLSRAFVSLGEASMAAVERVAETGDVLARSHAAVTQRMIERPDDGFDAAVLAVEADAS